MAARRSRKSRKNRRRGTWFPRFFLAASMLLLAVGVSLLYRERIYDFWQSRMEEPLPLPREISPAEELEEVVILGARELGVPRRRIGRRPGDGGRPHFEFRCPDRLHPISANRWLSRVFSDAGVKVLDCSEEGTLLRPKLNYLLGMGDDPAARATLTIYPPLGDPPLVGAQPRLAIIIDDFGHNFGRTVRGLLDLGVPITASILPGRNRSERIEREARRRGHAVFLHLPMEPLGWPEQDPGYGALFTGMSADSIGELLEELDSGFHELDGVNHHMGSRASTVDDVVRPMLDWAAREKLMVVDSYTAKRSRVYPMARDRELPTLRVDLFLDGEEESEARIAENLAQAAEIARKRGWVLVIGHPRPETLSALRKMLPRLSDSGLRFVTAPELLAGLDASDPAPPLPARPGPH